MEYQLPAYEQCGHYAPSRNEYASDSGHSTYEAWNALMQPHHLGQYEALSKKYISG